MQTGSRVGEVPVTLRVQELADRGHVMAEKVRYRESLVDSKKADAKKWQDQIDEADEEIARLARVICDGFESRGQGDLFADQVLTDEEAKKALADVAAAAGEGKPLPSEAHKFLEDPAKPEQCLTCGAGDEDPVHTGKLLHTFRHQDDAHETGSLDCGLCGYEEGAAIHSRHQFAADTVDGTLGCFHCLLWQGDAIHQPEPSPALVVAVEEALQEGGTVELFTCSRCPEGKRTHPKAEGEYLDAEDLRVCTLCRQLAIEAGTWKHAFEVDPKARVKRNQAPRCRHCEGLEVQEVHQLAEGATLASPAPEEASLVDQDSVPGSVSVEESMRLAKERVTGGPFDFGSDEPAPNVITTHPPVQP